MNIKEAELRETLFRRIAFFRKLPSLHNDESQDEVGKTVEATRNLKEALQSAQQRPTGEQKQQQERRQEQKEDRKQEQKQEQPDKPKRSRGVRR